MTESDKTGSVKITEVIARELEYVRLRRRHSLNNRFPPKNTLIGLALSGGGIRSATTNLGILQALSKMGVLPLVDYICTVSGGGYIGSCLSSLLTLPRTPGTTAPFFSTEWNTFPFNPNHRQGRAQLDHLRTHGSFLIARTGLLSRETMRSIGHLLSGTLYHLLIVLLALVIVAFLYLGGILRLAPELHEKLSTTTEPVQTLHDPAYEIRAEGPPNTTGVEKRIATRVFRNPRLIDRLWHKGQLVFQAATIAVTTPYGRYATIGTLVYGVLLSTIAFVILIRRGRLSGPPASSGESERDAAERWLLKRVGLTALVSTIVLFLGARYGCPTYAGVLWLLVPAMAMFAARVTSFFGHLLLPRLGRIWTRQNRSLWGAFQAMTFYAFWSALLLGLFPLGVYAVREEVGVVSISGVAALLLARLVTFRTTSSKRRWHLPPGILKWLLGLSIGVGVLLVILAICAAFVPSSPTSDVVPHESALLLQSAAIGALLFLVAGFTVDANRVSPHYFYRDRLGETYLYTEERRKSDGAMVTASDKGRNQIRMPLDKLHGPDAALVDLTRAGTAPYHLISTAINLAGSRDLTRKDRKSGYFLFSKFFCGSTHTNFRATAEYVGGETKVGRAMTISGAAASSGIGVGTFFAQAFATVLFNLRLGYWMPNPKFATSAHKSVLDRAYFWPRWLFREMFLRTDDRSPLVNLSDGGHTGDNVGIYPLLQRRCRVIVACDAERDPDLAFGSITEALRHAYIDYGIEVDIDFTMLRADPKTGMSRSHCAVGLIRYPSLARFGRQEDLPSLRDSQSNDNGDGELTGYLIYLKSSLTGDEPEPVLNYKSEQPAFPHETTVDQFFDDAQFESYRSLGVHIAEQSLLPWVATPEFQAFRREYWPFK